MLNAESVVPDVLDLRPRRAVELGYPDWLVAHFQLLIHFYCLSI